MKYYLNSTQEVHASLGVTKNGLSHNEAEDKLRKEGLNKLAEAKKKNLFIRFIEQLMDPMIIVLIAAALVSGILGEIADLIIILIVVLLNGVLGVAQEGKAEKAIEALQKMTSPYSKVRRDGKVSHVKSEEIVVGDIILLEAGDSVPADMRLIEAATLKIEEASLTGESIPVEKTIQALQSTGNDVPLGDRINMAYLGSSVVYGRGAGIVTGTAMSTEMGKIAGIISSTASEKTPLQKKMGQLSRVLSIGVIAICVFIFVFGVLKNGGIMGGHVLDIFMTAVSLAVAAIPEGLVAVVTIVLSIGVTKMSKRNSIIRRMTAVETLGCTQVICSDKTGTLTQNKMTVVDTWGDEEELAVSMTLCNDAHLKEDGSLIGDPTECALVTYAINRSKIKTHLESEMPRAGEAPFDSIRKMMTTIHKEKDSGFTQYTKGAPDEVLKVCTHILTENGVVPITDQLKQSVLTDNKRMAGKALRVLASAKKLHVELPSDHSAENLEQNMIFIGLAGMIDPVRPEVKAAIEHCRNAGIRPMMITGDHRDTAIAIAKELKIIKDDSEAITGAELNDISDSEFEKLVEKYSVYARVQPEHKVRIVNAWKKKGKITAMTGDGVNDAPALKSADIGIGMGITGTDVTKNVADIVLADDNFASIVYAVEEGRRIYDNIRKTIQFLLGSNLSEVLSLFVATILNFQLFRPTQILWINLVTDCFPALALGMETAEEDIMKKPARASNESVFSGGLGSGVIYQGIIIAALTLISYFIGIAYSEETGMTMAFLTLSMCEIFHSFNMRSLTKSIFSMKKVNLWLIGAALLSFVLTVIVIYIPGINNAFDMVALSLPLFACALCLAFVIIPIVEIVKLIRRIIK